MDTATERQDLSYSHEELMDWPRDGLSNLNPVRLRATSSLAIAQFLGAMIINLAMGCITGTLIPLVLLQLKQDPAQVSSILLTFVTDTGGFFIFLTLGSIFLL